MTDIFHKKSGGTTIDRFQYVYDGASNVTKRTDTSGNTVDYTYDNADQLKKEDYTGGGYSDIEYNYDSNSNLFTSLAGEYVPLYDPQSGLKATGQETQSTRERFHRLVSCYHSPIRLCYNSFISST